MPKSRRSLLIVLNILLMVVAVILLTVLTLRPVPHFHKSSHSQVEAKVQAATDIARLRSVIVQDEDYIRTLEELLSQSQMAARSVLILMGVLVGLNLVLLLLPQHSHQS